MTAAKTWIVVGASRGIGKEFVSQLLARGDHVIATVRKPSLEDTRSFWAKHERCAVYDCDMLSEPSIDVCFSPHLQPVLLVG